MKFFEGLFESSADAFKIIASYVIGTLAIVFCLYVAATQGPQPQLQILICILGGCLGWILGLYLTPSSEGEKQQFSDYSKGLAALATGFGLAKVDAILQWLQTSLSGDTQVTATRAILFACSILILGLFTYISRLHVRGSDEAKKAQRAKLIAELQERLSQLKAAS